MSKKVVLTTKPQTLAQPTPDEWVSATAPVESVVPQSSVPMKRLTIDVPTSLHAEIKSQCALRGKNMADEIRALLQQHFGTEE